MDTKRIDNSSPQPGGTTSYDIRRIGTHKFQVGEGPLWDCAEQTLYLIDLLARQVWRLHPATGDLKSWTVPSMIGSMALRASGGVIVALQDGVHWFDLERGETLRVEAPADLDQETQLNDGKVDARGRFVFGSQARSLAETRPLGAMYSLGTEGHIVRLDDTPFTIFNGPCWSPDGKTLYVGDSLPKRVYAYDYDSESGAVSNRRLFADTAPFGGIPDGATVDADGRVWITMCGGGKIVAFRPDGTVDRVIPVPTPFVTSVMFGGVGLDELYFTSIDSTVLGLQVDDPDGGGLFRISGLGVQGLPEPRYRG